MKKIFVNPSLHIVMVEDGDIVTQSIYYACEDDGDAVASGRRRSIWNDEE